MNSIGRGSWDAERDARLRDLWTQDDPRLSTREIAVRMALSKNAVVGRAHRLGLPARPSPIILVAADAAPAPKPRGAPPLRVTLPRPAPSPAPVRPALPTLPARLAGSRPARACRFIAGQPAGLATVYCEAATLPGSSYCPHHHAICHVRVAA